MKNFITINLKALHSIVAELKNLRRPLYPALWVDCPPSYTKLLKSYAGIVRNYLAIRHVYTVLSCY